MVNIVSTKRKRHGGFGADVFRLRTVWQHSNLAHGRADGASKYILRLEEYNTYG